MSKNGLPSTTKLVMSESVAYITHYTQWTPGLGHGSYKIILTFDNPTSTPHFIILTASPSQAIVWLQDYAVKRNKAIEKAKEKKGIATKDEIQLKLI